MKFLIPECRVYCKSSHPARGAWIEIVVRINKMLLNIQSHPARGAWIEMSRVSVSVLLRRVAPRKGCVD